MNVLSLFDGMSCGQIALERAGIKINKYFASEIKKHAIKVTQHNYPNTIQLGNIKNIKGITLPKIDLIIGGSPCQDFSLANNNRAGLQGMKSSLFYEYIRLLKECKPDYFLLENVNMEIEDKKIITDLLGVYPVEINSALVSAQNRVRLYWTNIPGETKTLFGNEISQPEDKKIMLKDILENGYTDREKSRAILESEERPLKNPNNMIHRYMNTGFTTLVFKDKETYLRVKEATKLGYIDVARGQCVDLSYPKSKTRRGRLMEDKSNCLLRKNEYYIFTGEDIRYFTQTELEKLQTVPVGYTKILSRNEAACLLGDGWTVDVIVHIFKGLPKPKQGVLI